MSWDKILGQEKVKHLLIKSIELDRLSHAQLFISKEGSGGLLLALAYAKAIIENDKKNQTTNSIVNELNHPDIHFIFPNNSSTKVKAEKTESSKYLSQFRDFIKTHPYGNLTDWLSFIDIEKKQGIINVRDAETIIHKMSFKSYEGGHKIVIIWYPENMNSQAANKLLKLLEEPALQSVFILVSENINAILPTIISRCQLVKINSYKVERVSSYLIDTKNINQEMANNLAVLSNGNLNKAIKLAEDSPESIEFENYFVKWVRSAFMAKKNIVALKELVNWSNEISLWGREKQKNFITFSIAVFREALLNNFELGNCKFNLQTINWETFSSYINGANIEEILNELNKAHYHIERNVNAKMVFLDTSIKITRYLHKQQLQNQ